MTTHRNWKHYVLYASAWAVGLTAAGACVGAIVYPLFGMFADSPTSLWTLALKGTKELGFLTFIWAPGIGIVLAFHRAHLNKQRSCTK